MANKQQMVSETRGIGQLINERRYFEVPPHQRDYAWPIGTVEQYIEDVVGAMNAGSEYFLGLIVLVDTDNPTARRYEILDGQQRLATTTMIFAAIRQWMRDHGLDSEGSKIQNEFIGISEIGEEQDEPRIVMNLNNREVFQEVVVNSCADKVIEKKLETAGRFSSTRRLVDAALRCRQFVAELAEKEGGESKKQAGVLFDLAKYLRDKVQVNCLDVTAPENAYTIFEALNDRGIDLSVLDLLKNHLFREAGASKKDQVQSNWSQMVGRLGDRRADNFLKAFWTSRYGRIQRGRLFHELKRKYHTKAQVLTLARELGDVAETYSNLEIADSDLWRQYGVGVQECVRALALLEGAQTHPILLAAQDRFGQRDMVLLMRRLVTLILRYQLIGRGRTGRLEIKAAAVASAIYTRKLRGAKAVWQELKTLLPPDDEFKQDFGRYEERRPARARWLLRELEGQEWKERNPGKGAQMAPLADPEKVNLEHILPRHPDNSWEAVLREDPTMVEECGNCLGNMCLLDKPTNKKQASKAFTEKRPSYEESEFLLTRAVAEEFGEWDRSAVEKRQARLAELALLAWPSN